MAPPFSAIQRLRGQLLARIRRRYQTVTQELRIGGLKIQFTRIADADRVLDEVVAEEDRREKVTGIRIADPLHLPYWAELWDSGLGLAHHLFDRPMPANLRVLDLGCGMGLAGAVAAARGAEVLFADLESPALLFARLNTVAYADRVRTRRLNWQTDRLAARFDLILGSDILYEIQQWEHLNAFWLHHLAPQGRILLGEPGRQSGDQFPDWIGGKTAWAFTTILQTVPGRPRPIRIFELGGN
jgi:predicted nicotinamide N-methyase